MAPSKPPHSRAARLLPWLTLLGTLAGGCVIDAERPLDPRVRCSDGQCVCVDGLASCDGNADNGCETNLLVDPLHCGACGHACVNSSCQAGVCACHSGYQDCDGLADTVCESDLARDSLHCGGCSRDCRGGACIDHECQPLTLAEGLMIPRHLAIGGGRAFYSVVPGGALTDEHGILASALDAPATPSVLLHHPDEVTDLAFDGEQLFWLADSVLQSMTPSPTSPVTTVAGPFQGAMPMALSASHVYVTFHDGQLARVPKTGGPPVTLAANAYSRPIVGEQHVYWAEDAGPIWRQALSGGSTEYFDSLDFWFVAQLHAGVLYWLHSGNGGYDLYRKPESPGPREHLASLPTDESRYTLAIVDGGIFVSARDHGTIERLPLAGGEPTIIAQGQVNVDRVAADDQFVYWLANDRLMRLVLLP